MTLASSSIRAPVSALAESAAWNEVRSLSFLAVSLASVLSSARISFSAFCTLISRRSPSFCSSSRSCARRTNQTSSEMGLWRPPPRLWRGKTVGSEGRRGRWGTPTRGCPGGASRDTSEAQARNLKYGPGGAIYIYIHTCIHIDI